MSRNEREVKIDHQEILGVTIFYLGNHLNGKEGEIEEVVAHIIRA